MKVHNSVISFILLGSGKLFDTSSSFSPVVNSGSSQFRESHTSIYSQNPSESVFLDSESAKACIEKADGTPLYAYSVSKLNQNADACLSFPNAFGLTVRYAMKACPNGAILKLFNKKGIHIDASSGF
mmetsp:Transcript_8850/g.12595  ORF Transcript_8850/g.12595 Transcript_8850/m.12595 type:complete len:127 (-) Transcript_8850:11-391(-)